jgi:hypothetical protein
LLLALGAFTPLASRPSVTLPAKMKFGMAHVCVNCRAQRLSALL